MRLYLLRVKIEYKGLMIYDGLVTDCDGTVASLNFKPSKKFDKLIYNICTEYEIVEFTPAYHLREPAYMVRMLNPYYRAAMNVENNEPKDILIDSQRFKIMIFKSEESFLQHLTVQIGLQHNN